MNNTALSAIATKVLPLTNGNTLTYNAVKNAFLTSGYTSLANNFYYQVLRVSRNLIIAYDLGQGYAHTFLNGIMLFCWDGDKARIIAQKTWGGGCWCCFSEQYAKEQSIGMLKEYLMGQFKIAGHTCIEKDVMDFARNVVEETHVKRLM